MMGRWHLKIRFVKSAAWNHASCRLGLCPECVNPELATIPPTPTHQNEATIAPGGTHVSDLSTHERVGEYELIEEIARGGMGVVYKAKHRNLNRITAVKMILGGRFSSSEELQRFQVEAESAAKLDHPAIVPIYEIGECEGQAFFAMKYIDGGSLADHAASLHTRPRDTAKLLLTVAEAVHHAHQRGVLHRDLKPANILLDKNEAPFVTDLGLAKSTTGGSDLTHTGAVLGTPSYMPPEQAAGKAVTTAADIYSLGAIMYELLAGRPPYKGDTTLSVVMQVLDSAPKPPSKFDASVDRDLELICLKCLERDPESRYATAQEMANDLEAWLAGDSISIKPPSIKAVLSNWLKQNQRLVYVAFALIVGVLVCAPIVLTFFSDDLASVYEKFPDDQLPLMFSLSLPQWLSIFFAIVLFLVIWPSIGLLNAVISKPKTFGKAIVSGIGTSAILSLIFFVLVGWMIVIQTVNNFSRSNVRTMTDAVWPAEDESAAEATENANQLYGGLHQIPQDERSAAVSRRIMADHFATVPVAFLIGILVSCLFSIPIIYGTLVGAVLAKRDISWWVFVLRYVIAWWTISALLISVLMLTASRFSTQIKVQSTVNSGLIGVAVMLLVIFLALRKWRRTPKLA